MSTSGLTGAWLNRMHTVLSGYGERGDLPGLAAPVNRWGEARVGV